MKSKSIEALIAKSRKTLGELKDAYERSLHEQAIREDLRVDIKKVFENLRSCLDYLAHELFEKHCTGQKVSRRLYFPVRRNAAEFAVVMNSDYPGLQTKCKAAYDYLESLESSRPDH